MNDPDLISFHSDPTESNNEREYRQIPQDELIEWATDQYLRLKADEITPVDVKASARSLGLPALLSSRPELLNQLDTIRQGAAKPHGKGWAFYAPPAGMKRGNIQMGVSDDLATPWQLENCWIDGHYDPRPASGEAIARRLTIRCTRCNKGLIEVWQYEKRPLIKNIQQHEQGREPSGSKATWSRFTSGYLKCSTCYEPLQSPAILVTEIARRYAMAKRDNKQSVGYRVASMNAEQRAKYPFDPDLYLEDGLLTERDLHAFGLKTQRMKDEQAASIENFNKWWDSKR